MATTETYVSSYLLRPTRSYREFLQDEEDRARSRAGGEPEPIVLWPPLAPEARPQESLPQPPAAAPAPTPPPAERAVVEPAIVRRERARPGIVILAVLAAAGLAGCGYLYVDREAAAERWATERAALTQQIEDGRKRSEVLEATLAESRRNEDAVRNLRTEIAAAERRRDELAAEVANAQAMLRSAQEELAEVRARAREAGSAAETMAARAAETDARLQALQRSADERQATVANLDARIDQLNRESVRAEQELNAVRAATEAAERRRAEAQDGAARLEREVEARRRTIEALQGGIAAARRELDETLDKLRALEGSGAR